MKTLLQVSPRLIKVARSLILASALVTMASGGASAATWPVATAPAGNSVSTLPTFIWADSTAGAPYQLLALNSVGKSVINQKNIYRGKYNRQ